MYVKYGSEAEAISKCASLQAYHTGRNLPGPRIIDAVVPTWDGQYALTLLEGDDWQDIGSGVVVESIAQPKIEGPEL